MNFSMSIFQKLRQSKKCKLLDILEQNEAKNPKYTRTYDENNAIIELIINETGIDVTNKTKNEIFEDLDRLYDTLDVLVNKFVKFINLTNDRPSSDFIFVLN